MPSSCPGAGPRLFLCLLAAFGAGPLLGTLTGCSSSGGGVVGDDLVEERAGYYRLSSHTREAFGLRAAALDSLQFFLSGPVAYVAEEEQADPPRVAIGPATPGSVVGGHLEAAEASGDWSHLDVDFGGFVVRFKAGRGGRLSASAERPVLYYAPAGEIAVEGRRYRLDRRAYGGATLVFRNPRTAASASGATSGRATPN